MGEDLHESMFQVAQSAAQLKREKAQYLIHKQQEQQYRQRSERAEAQRKAMQVAGAKGTDGGNDDDTRRKKPRPTVGG